MPCRTLLQGIFSDRLLLCAVAVCLLLIGYQLSVTLIQPPWIGPVTDWVRAALAWPQALVMAWVAVALRRTHRSGASTVGWGALGLLSYAIARTLWTIDDLVIYPHGVPFPSLPDLLFILQYPCFVLAFALLPERGGWLPGLRVMVDGVLWISAITALDWYFLMLPLYLQSGEPPLSKFISLFYKVGDLVLLYGLVVGIARRRFTNREPLAMFLLSLAIIALFVGDILAGRQLLQPPYTYRAGSVPDLFRFICYLVFPLAALVQLRLVPVQPPSRRRDPVERVTRQDMLAGIAFVAPSLAVAFASAVIIIDATVTSRNKGDLMLPEVVGIALLLLATLRPAVTYIEQERMRRERDAARAQERALRLANERMEAFLSMVAHELRTPLTSLIGNVHLMGGRLDTLLRRVRSHEDYMDVATMLRTLIGWSDQGLGRMRRLVEDVLDETRVRQGRLALRLEACNLVSIVSQVVEEQMALNPERSIRWVAETSPVPVLADAGRIEQVVANLVSNALKFSSADQLVEVRVQTKDGMAWVSVRDEGAGIPAAEQPRIWERFYQARGVDVASGSQIGFGIGLYISKAIVEGHQGHVGVESAPGQGTTIWFTLPLASARAEAEAGGAASSLQLGEHEPEHD